MANKSAQETIELSEPPAKRPVQDVVGAPPLGRRIFSVRNVVSFLLAVTALYLMYRELLGVDWGETWASVRGANSWFFALAFLIFYCSFPLRALRWEVLLADVGYSGDAGQPFRQPSG